MYRLMLCCRRNACRKPAQRRLIVLYGAGVAARARNRLADPCQTHANQGVLGGSRHDQLMTRGNHDCRPPPSIIGRDEAKALGLKRFFTGEPCKHGHVAERYVGRYGCVECDRASALEWRVANVEWARERERAAAYKYRAANPEKDRERKRKWRAANPEKAREHQRRWLAKIGKRPPALQD